MDPALRVPELLLIAAQNLQNGQEISRSVVNELEQLSRKYSLIRGCTFLQGILPLCELAACVEQGGIWDEGLLDGEQEAKMRNFRKKLGQSFLELRRSWNILFGIVTV